MDWRNWLRRKYLAISYAIILVFPISEEICRVNCQPFHDVMRRHVFILTSDCLEFLCLELSLVHLSSYCRRLKQCQPILFLLSEGMHPSTRAPLLVLRHLRHLRHLPVLVRALDLHPSPSLAPLRGEKLPHPSEFRVQGGKNGLLLLTATNVVDGHSMTR